MPVLDGIAGGLTSRQQKNERINQKNIPSSSVQISSPIVYQPPINQTEYWEDVNFRTRQNFPFTTS